MAIKPREKQIIMEYLRNETKIDGSEITAFDRKMREKGIFKR